MKIKTALATLLAGIALTACGSSTPTVDWAAYQPGLQERIDTQMDCTILQDEADAAWAARETKAAANSLFLYIAAHAENLGCPGF